MSELTALEQVPTTELVDGAAQAELWYLLTARRCPFSGLVVAAHDVPGLDVAVDASRYTDGVELLHAETE